MGYDFSTAATIASHAVLIALAIALIAALLRVWHVQRLGAAVSAGVIEGLCILAVTIATERAYYVAARLLRRTGRDLWSAHPAPELLAAFVSLGFIAALFPLVAVICQVSWYRAAMLVCGWSVSLWGAAFWVLI